MSIARRKIIGLFAASAATAIAGCGGGGGGSNPTRFVWVLNLNPNFLSAEVSYGNTVVAPVLPFRELTPRIEVGFGTYSVRLRDRTFPPRDAEVFAGVVVDANSAAIEVFYRNGSSSRLGAAPSGIVNYFDSNEPLVVELDDGSGNNFQTSVLAFEGAVAQDSQSSNCRLRVLRASDGLQVFDSGPRQRPGTILIFPSDPFIGTVGVVGLNYNSNSAVAEIW